MQIIYIHSTGAIAKAQDPTLNPPVDLEGAALHAEAKAQQRGQAGSYA